MLLSIRPGIVRLPLDDSPGKLEVSNQQRLDLAGFRTSTAGYSRCEVTSLAVCSCDTSEGRVWLPVCVGGRRIVFRHVGEPSVAWAVRVPSRPSMQPVKEHLAARPRAAGVRPIVSTVLDDGSIVETVYDAATRGTQFCVYRAGTWRLEPTLQAGGERLVPYSGRNNLIENHVILLPSEPLEYSSDQELIANIRAYIHRYVDVSPLYERIASYYVLLSWVYESFNELPYLRLRGDPGSGKTRFLLIAGSICYKPIFASGASTVSPIFRILDAVRGTLIIDEGDFRFSDEKAELVKILNNGNARGFPVLRSETTPQREFNPRAYHVFGPKLVATRGYFEDRALESRCLTEEMGQGSLREDIPINLPADYRADALTLRNKLLLFRLRNLHRQPSLDRFVDRGIEPRLNQIFAPLLSLVEDEVARGEMRAMARQYHRDLLAERGLDTEAQVLEIIRDIVARAGRLSVKEITQWFVDRHGEDYERKITTKWIGHVIRRRLQLRTLKNHGTYVVPPEEALKLAALYRKYGIDATEAASPRGDGVIGAG